MADNFIGLDEPTTIDKKLDTEQLTVGENTVERERMQLAGAAATEIARVKNSNPAGSDMGLVVRPAQGFEAATPVFDDPIDRALRDMGKVDVAAFDTSLPAGTNNIGDVDVLSLPALPAGSNNIGDVDVLSLPALPAGSNNIGDVDLAQYTPVDVDTGAGTDNALPIALRFPASGGGVNAPGDAANGLDVDVTRLPALPAGSNNIGDVDVLTLPSIPAGTNNIGDVDVLTVPADPFGLNADAASATGSISAKLRFIAATGIPITSLPASTNTLEVVGDVAHDNPVGGNPVSIGGVGETAADSAPSTRASTDGDIVRLAVDLDGSNYVLPHGPQVWSYHLNTSTAQTDATVKAAPGAGLSLYVTDIVVSLGAATALNVFFEEGASTVLGPFYLEAVNGRGLHIQFRTPKKITVNTALTVTTSASVAHSVEVTGYTAPG